MADLNEAQTLGAVAVAVGGNMDQLLAVLASARQAVEAFDKDMATGSGGMLQFTVKANEAAAAVDTQAQKTKAAGTTATDAAQQVNKLSDANDRAAKSSRTAAAAAETEAEKNERLAAVIDRTMERMQARETLRLRTGSLPGIESAGIPGDYVANPALRDAMMGTAEGRIPAEALAGAVGAGAGAEAGNLLKDLEGTSKGLKDAGGAMEELGGKTKITSTAMREFITIPREIASGNWSRVPGSISILAQQMGLLNVKTLPLIGGFAAAAVALAVFGIAAIEGSREFNELSNSLQLAGGKAGFTADTLVAAADRIANATNTSSSSARAMAKALAESNDFTKSEIEALVDAAERLQRATGQTAEESTKDFLKMAENPLKYAEAFQHAHTDIISPTMMAHLRNLDRRGEKEQELADLIRIVTDGIAKNTVDNISTMQRWWDGFINSVKSGWQAFKEMVSGTIPLAEQIADKNELIRHFQSEGRTVQVAALTKERDALQGQLDAQQKSAAARAADAAAADRQNQAITRLNATYLKGIDAPNRYANDLKKMHDTLAEAVRLPATAPQADIIAAALKSSDAGVRDLATHYSEAATRIKREDMSVQFKADTKAANAAAAAARRLEREAEALEKRRQEEITALRDESDSLEAIAPLYQDQSASLDDVNRAKAITTALTKAKLTAESDEGRTIAQLAGHVYDLTAAISAETEARRARDEFEKHIAGVRAQATAVNDNRDPADAAAEQAAYTALDDSLKRRRDLVEHDQEAGLIDATEAQRRLTEIERDGSVAREKLDQDVSNARDARRAVDTAKFFEETDQTIAKTLMETRTIGESKTTTDEATIRIRLMTEAKKKHVEMTDENIAKINAEAHAMAAANAGFNRATRLNQYAPDASKYQVTGQDYHSLDQSLGGRFKQQDDLKVLQDEIRKREAIVAQEHKDGIINEQEYEARLTQIHADGEAERRKIKLETVDMELQAGQQIADAMTSMAADMFGKQSRAYRAMFDISKGFAIAQAALAMEQDIAKALSMGFPQNIPLIAAAAAQGAMIVSDIRSIALTFAGGGFVSGPGGPTGDSIPAWLSDGEFVTNAAATAQWRPVLESINAGRMPSLPMPANDGGGGPRVTIHNHAPGVEHEVRYATHGEVEIIAKKAVRRDAPKVVAADITRPNSPTNKALTRTTTARPRRTG